jgi:hypothetical protein
MTQLNINPNLLERLAQIAQAEQRTLEQVAEDLIEASLQQYLSSVVSVDPIATPSTQTALDPIEALIGIAGNAGTLSEGTRERLAHYSKDQSGWSSKP